MKFVLTSDIHLHPFRQCSRNAGLDRLDDGLGAMKQTLLQARARKCHWFFLGDLKHIKNMWHQQALNSALQLMEDFEDVPKMMVHGNHDGMAGGSGLLPFKSIPKTNIFVEPEIVYGDNYDFETFAVWPHQKDLRELPAFIKKAKDAKVKILFAHIFISGSQVSSTNVPVVKGTMLSEIGISSVKSDNVFDWAFLGDIHRQQVVPDSGKYGTAIYPGAPLGLNWGERGEKGALYVDTQKRLIEPIMIDAPKFVVLDWVGQKIEPGDWDARWPDDFVRIYVLPDVKPKVMEKIREQSKARWFEVVVRREETNVEKRSEIHSGMTTNAMLDEYIKARPLQQRNRNQVIPKKKLMEIGKKLLEGDDG